MPCTVNLWVHCAFCSVSSLCLVTEFNFELCTVVSMCTMQLSVHWVLDALCFHSGMNHWWKSYASSLLVAGGWSALNPLSDWSLLVGSWHLCNLWLEMDLLAQSLVGDWIACTIFCWILLYRVQVLTPVGGFAMESASPCICVFYVAGSKSRSLVPNHCDDENGD